MSYTLLANADGSANASGVLRDDGSIVPNDASNTDWQAYQAWLLAGNAPSAATIPPAPPAQYTFLQFMALFTAAEQSAIVQSADPNVRLFLPLLAMPQCRQHDRAKP